MKIRLLVLLLGGVTLGAQEPPHATTVAILDEGYQSVPVNWGISWARKRGFFDLVSSMSNR